MGICESSNSDIKQTKKDKELNSPNSKNINQENENINYLETHQSSNNQNDNKISINLEMQNKECPQLAQYERSNFRSDISYTNNNTQSLMSEEEIIIKGEINKNCKNKDEDFDNSSFKRLIKNNGGIIIKNKDQIRILVRVKELIH